MDRYTLIFLILVGWFVVFRMFPADFQEENRAFCGTVDNDAASGDQTGDGDGTGGGDASKGRLAFNANCARCHNPNISKKSTGPALAGVGSRMPGGEWIYKWVRNPSKMIADGDTYAVKIWNENAKATMDPFPNLSNETIDDIMAWINSYAVVHVCR